MEEKKFIQSPADGNPTSGVPIRLTHAALVTSTLDPSIRFYVDVLGLHLRVKEEDPLRPGRMRAMLTDVEGNDIIELIEFHEMPHASVPGRGAIHHVGFCLPKRDWHALRSRLDAAGYPYQEIENRLFIRDADSVVLEIEVSTH